MRTILASDDPRHGTTRGASAGCSCRGCRDARNADERRRRKYRDVLGIERRTDAIGTQRRIRALIAIGWTGRDISERCGWSTPEATTDLLKPRRFIYATTAAKVAAAYEELCMIPGPSVKNRREAQRKGWPVPLAWDDIDTDPEPVARSVRCSITDCGDAARSRGWCDAHYRRWLRLGDPEGVRKMGRPRGEAASYNAVHLRLKRDRGLARDHACADCGEPARTWSYNHDDPEVCVDERGRPYTVNLHHYSPRCMACHNTFDRRRPGNKAALRLAELHELDERLASISEACSHLNMRRGNLETWCQRNGVAHVYSRMVAREQPDYDRLVTSKRGAA